MSSPDFSEISNAISEASREGSRIFASALVDLTQKTSDEIGHQFTIGTRKVFESTREAWNEGGERFSACLKPEMNKLIAGYFALQKSTLEDRWKVTQSGFRGALESCMKNLDLLEKEILHESAFHLVSVYKASTEESFLSLLQCSLHTSSQCLVYILQTSLLDNRSTNSHERRSDLGRTKAREPEYELHMNKDLVDNIEEGLCDSYRLLEKVIEEGARRTLFVLHATFIACQSRLFEKLQEVLERGLEEVTAASTSALSSHLLPVYHQQNTCLDSFSSALTSHLGSLLSTRAQALAAAQRVVFEEAARDLTTAQVEVIKNNVVRLTREQKNQVNSEVVPMMLAVLERELGEGFI